MLKWIRVVFRTYNQVHIGIPYINAVRCSFVIKTPLRSFDLQAKHQVAATEWVNALNSMRLRKEKVKGTYMITVLQGKIGPIIKLSFGTH